MRGGAWGSGSGALTLTLNKLKSHHEIIIKPADKGGQIVIQDRTNYILEATRQLNDPVYYRPLTNHLETQTMVRL